MEKKEDMRGKTGSKENVGRKPITYEKKTLYKKNVPLEVYDLCKSLVDAEILKWRLKNKC
jgi:hypothetical protein